MRIADGRHGDNCGLRAGAYQLAASPLHFLTRTTINPKPFPTCQTDQQNGPDHRRRQRHRPGDGPVFSRRGGRVVIAGRDEAKLDAAGKTLDAGNRLAISPPTSPRSSRSRPWSAVPRNSWAASTSWSTTPGSTSRTAALRQLTPRVVGPADSRQPRRRLFTASTPCCRRCSSARMA